MEVPVASQCIERPRKEMSYEGLALPDIRRMVTPL